jgi:hypothetical protein
VTTARLADAFGLVFLEVRDVIASLGHLDRGSRRVDALLERVFEVMVSRRGQYFEQLPGLQCKVDHYSLRLSTDVRSGHRSERRRRLRKL